MPAELKKSLQIWKHRSSANARL